MTESGAHACLAVPDASQETEDTIDRSVVRAINSVSLHPVILRFVGSWYTETVRVMTLATRSPYPLVTVPDAQKLVDQKAVALSSEEVSLKEAHGRVLAQVVCATDDLPPFPASIKVLQQTTCLYIVCMLYSTLLSLDLLSWLSQRSHWGCLVLTVQLRHWMHVSSSR